MAKKKEIIEEKIQEYIVNTPVEEVMSQGFGRYSKYVLQERAVPDVRDGLKPVQRRILYTMFLEGNISNKPTRKCARTVGQVIGRFHPHGDTSVYEAMVRMSQDWKMRVPLIDFQGNNGSIDGDSAAAYRYTEARLSEISDFLVLDLNKDTVDMELNFDDLELEPTVLPGRFPNLLVNGAQGIAMGASTDIPPHNLVEVTDAIIYRIQHKNAKVSDLLSFVKGPDFPTGGVILNAQDLPSIYETGKGLIRLMAKTHMEAHKDFQQIVITEIPFAKDKSELVNSIDRLRFQQNLTAITEVRDETDKDGLRIAIDIKKDADAEALLKFIISKGVLTTSVKFNMLVIDHNRPRTLGLLQVIDCYIEHQIEVITRRSRYDLKKMETRLHIVEGLIQAVSMLDAVIALIRSSKDKQDAKRRLVEELHFTEAQAEALLILQLYRLSNTDVTTLIKEAEDLRAAIARLNELLTSPTKMNQLIVKDLRAIADTFGNERRTTFQTEELDLSVNHRDIIEKEETIVAFTFDGYFKRSQPRSYQSSNGSLPGLKDGDAVKGIRSSYTTDFLLAFTNRGNCCYLPVYKLFDAKWKEEGKHINELVTLDGSEKIIGGLVVSNFKSGIQVVLVSKLGQIKRTALKDLEVTRASRPIRCFKLLDEDEVVDMTYTVGNSEVCIVNSLGQASLFSETDIPLVSPRAGGVKAMSSSKEKAFIAGVCTLTSEENCRLLLLTDHHGARIVDPLHIPHTARLGSKTSLFKSFKSDPQQCIHIQKVAKKFESLFVTVVLKNHATVTLDLKELKPQVLDSYLKKNLELDSPFPIERVFQTDVARIDESIKVFLVPEKIKEVKAEEEEFEQLSLFDYIDDDF